MFTRTEKGSLVNLNIVEIIRIQDTQVIANLNAKYPISEVVLLTSDDRSELEEYVRNLEEKVCAAV